MNKTRQWPRRKLFLFSGLSFFMFFLLAEVICRVLVYARYQHYHTSVYIQGSPLKTGDSALVFANQPYYLDYDKNYQYNGLGMKSCPGDAGAIAPKSTNEFRVLLTGASAMEGMGSNKNGEWMDITGVTDHPWNKSIAFYLGQYLQDSLPGKKVEVFNAACSAYQAWQSFGRWQTLQQKVQPDWVVSMDGANEPTQFHQGENYRAIQAADWAGSPQFHFPLNIIVALTRYSALINGIKQRLFHFKQSARLRYARDQGYPVKQQWLDSVLGPTQFASSKAVAPAVDSFFRVLLAYDSALSQAGIRHLLLVQPHLCLRDTTINSATEKALLHYYNAMFNDSLKNTFMRDLHDRITKGGLPASIVSMSAVHQWKEPVFVDYCHFTEITNRRIALELCRYILSNKINPPFNIN